MINLHNPEELKKIDPKNALHTTELLIKQCQTAWEEVNTLNIPHHIENIKNIVFCGMGASMYGAFVLKSLLGRNISYPIEIISDYYVPDYVDNQTLVVLISYSGSTEEVLSCAEDAKAKEAKILVLTKGGELSEFAKDNEITAYVFDDELNISGTPRLGCGYTIFGLIALLNKTGIIDIEEHEVTNAFLRFDDKFEDIKNQALQDCELLKDKIPVVIAAEHLSANAQILRNQFNETSKTFATFFLIPDLNHHLMEGLQFPDSSQLHFIFLSSEDYSDKIQNRIKLTKDIIEQHNYSVSEYVTSGQTIYDDFLEVLLYGSFVSLYLGFMYNQNPAGNPWVDYFKSKLFETEKK
jgi:glucose/mannose-6-phosphate isomerase